MYLTPLETHVQRFMYFHIYVAYLLSVFIPHSSTKPDFLYKKVNRNVQEEPQAEVAANPPTPGGREKVTQINACIANIQMHDKHKNQLPLLQAR